MFKIYFQTFFALSLLTVSSLSFAEQQKIPVQEIRSIVIKALHLDLKVKKNSSKFYTIKWTGNLSLKNTNKILSIQSSNFNSKKLWNSPVPKTLPVLEISGPSLPIQLYSFFSKSDFSHWTKPVFISSFKGHIKASKSKSPWEISLKEGSIHVHQQKGPLSVKGFNVNLSLNSSEGDFQFFLNEGQLRVKKSKGALNFITDKAKIHLTQFKGSLEGSSQSGAVTATIQPETVNLFTDKSPLRISFMGQAPRITAYTEKGKIYGARHLYKQFSGKSTKVSGRVRGSVKKGTVSLKTETGNIYIN